MYWTGQVGGPNGDNFSFYGNWIMAQQKLSVQDGGFLLVIKTGSGTHKLWVTRETMLSIAEHEAKVLEALVRFITTEYQFALQHHFQDAKPTASLFDPTEYDIKNFLKAGFPKRLGTHQQLVSQSSSSVLS